jgi:hypothetical protein
MQAKKLTRFTPLCDHERASERSVKRPTGTAAPEKPEHERTTPCAMPKHFPPEKLPDPWLIDSEYFLNQLANIRELALKVPFRNDNYQQTNTVVDALWRLEQQLRYLLHLHRDGQRAFAAKAESQISQRHQAEKDALEKNIKARKRFRNTPAFAVCANKQKTHGHVRKRATE